MCVLVFLKTKCFKNDHSVIYTKIITVCGQSASWFLKGTPREIQSFEKMSKIGNHPGDLNIIFSDSAGKNKEKMDQPSSQNRTPKLGTFF
jgi:hypothetical protein